jgi:altronate dehydratase small subunit
VKGAQMERRNRCLTKTHLKQIIGRKNGNSIAKSAICCILIILQSTGLIPEKARVRSINFERRKKMAQKSKAIVINEKDNVATAIVSLKVGDSVSLAAQGHSGKIKILSPIQMGHKFALAEIPKGADVIKYGEAIGHTTASIARGEHVHTHNVVSHRGRKEGA